MLKNYFYLRRAAKEFDVILENKKISEIFTQDKDTLYFNLSSEELPYEHLVLSTYQNLPYLLVKEDHRRAKKNTVDFFHQLLGATINSVMIAEGERIIEISTTFGDLYFMLRGNNSNIFFLDIEGNLHPFKESKLEDEKLMITELDDIKFSNDFTPDLSGFDRVDIENVSMKELRKNYPNITKEILAEIKSRTDGLTNTEKLLKITGEIGTSDIKIYFDEFEKKACFYPSDFNISGAEECRVATTYNDGVRLYLSTYYSNIRKTTVKDDIAKFLTKELERHSSKLNSLKKRVDDGSKEELYYKYGNLLLTNIYKLKKGMESIQLTDPVEEDSYVVALEAKLAPKQNIDKYFSKARNEKINYEKSKELYENELEKYNYYLSLKDKFEKIENFKEYDDLAKKLKIKKDTGKKMNTPDYKIKLREYLIDDKYHIFVGKDSESNDLLSTKFGKQNDFWFHARGLPGSHVVLRVDNSKEVVPKSVLKTAAAVAAFYSKAKTAKIAPVSYTFCKFVYKKKGMNPGQVAISKEQVLTVRPEIPNNAVPINE